MARSPTKTTSKKRAGGKARARAATGDARASKARASKGAASSKRSTPGKGAASKRRSTAKLTGAKAPGRRTQARSESWASSMSTLLSSDLSREVVAEVLDAAAGVLRQNREVGRQVQATGQTMLERSTGSASNAVRVGTEVASGAVDAGTEIAAAAAHMAQTAAGALAAMATNAMLNMMPGASTAVDEKRTRRRKRGAGKSPRQG
jgi:hypothetical protein